MARLGLAVQPPVDRRDGEQLDLDQLLQDFVEFGGARGQPLAGLHQPLHPGLHLDIGDVDHLPVDARRLGREIALGRLLN